MALRRHVEGGSHLAGLAPGSGTCRAWEVQPGTPAGTGAQGQPVQQPVLQGPSGWADLQKSALLSSIGLSILHVETQCSSPRSNERRCRNVRKWEDAERGQSLVSRTSRCVRFNSSSSASGDRPPGVWGQSASRAHTEPSTLHGLGTGVLGRIELLTQTLIGWIRRLAVPASGQEAAGPGGMRSGRALSPLSWWQEGRSRVRGHRKLRGGQSARDGAEAGGPCTL